VKIDISGVKSDVGAEETHVLEERIDDLAADGVHVRLEGPVRVRARLTNTGPSVLAEVEARVSGEVRCSRCLEPFRIELRADYSEEFREGAPEDGPPHAAASAALRGYEDDEIDLSPGLREALLLELPMKPVCSEDCRGLCPRCGANLNERRCDCEVEEIDRRWERLKDLAERMRPDGDTAGAEERGCSDGSTEEEDV